MNVERTVEFELRGPRPRIKYAPPLQREKYATLLQQNIKNNEESLLRGPRPHVRLAPSLAQSQGVLDILVDGINSLTIAAQ